MFTAKRVPLRIILPFAWRPVLFFLAYSTLICLLFQIAGWHSLAVPFLPIGLIGTAVAFYVGFKNNSSYERLWEGRRIWGSLVNASRSWAIMVCDYIVDRDDPGSVAEKELRCIRERLIYRNIAYLNALRIQLRRRTVWQECVGAEHEIIEHIEAFRQNDLDKELGQFLSKEEVESVLRKQNPATHLIRNQSADLRDLRARGLLSDYYHAELQRLLVEFYNQQGACERIKSFPFPRQYAFFGFLFVWLFIFVLPYGLLGEMAKMGDWYTWLTIPFYTVIAWVFYTMEVIGDTSENPFENSINDVPLSAICRNVEIDLKEMLGETGVPERLQAVQDILM
ncbi:bestrophin family protein [Larkinella soli]|uniref:bestrophin family protein n=1 Tax=Larkinella soli TaxID=1770527 RepID=UPI000FFB4780|nr:bestrophin family ion channel [Larkinella soli]